MHCAAAPRPNPIALRRAILPHHRNGQAPSNAEAAALPSQPRQALSFGQGGEHITIAVHERLASLDLLLYPGIKRGERISGRSFDGENLLAFLGMEMPEHFLGQNKAGRCPDFPELEREHDGLQRYYYTYYNVVRKSSPTASTHSLPPRLVPRPAPFPA